jgi:hypothetical protein
MDVDVTMVNNNEMTQVAAAVKKQHHHWELDDIDRMRIET